MPLSKPWHSFTARTVLAALGMHVLLAVAIGYGTYRIISADLKDEYINAVRSQARQFGLSIGGYAGSPAAVETMLQDALLGGQVVFVELVLDSGRILPPRAEKTAERTAFVEDFSFDARDSDVYHIAVPVKPADESLRGTLRLGFDKKQILERIHKIYERGTLLILGYLAASLTLAWVSGNLLSGSIRRLRDAARRVAQGRTDQPLEIPTRIAEVASLAQDLELMRRELVRQASALHSRAYFDGLTGLANRMLFSERLAAALNSARRADDKVAVLYLDLDRFKRVNDTLGHHAGDELLKRVGERMKAALREGDDPWSAPERAQEAVARLGGDEFAILLRGIASPAAAGVVADRVLDALCEPILIGAHRVYATASIGIAIFPLDGAEPQLLLKNADAAMYHAKQRGKNCFQYYMGSMNVTAAARLELESELHRALELDQFVLHYQPQTDVETGALTGAEALIRWQHPQRGLIPPDQFISIAEESGVIVPIGEWVIRTACAQFQAWREQGIPLNRISVNVSPRQFQQQSLISTVAAAVADYGMGRDTLDLEITETSLMVSEEDAIARLDDLRRIGVGLSIDDFGTGYSSLTYLKRFAVESLKIDQSFIQDIPENPHNAAIVRAIVVMAKSLNINVIAEGVETRRQWQYLLDNGCREMQGYFVSCALPVAAFEKFVLQMPKPGRPGRLYGIKT